MSLKAGFAHTVFFWVKEDTTDEQRRAFEEGLTKLGTVPSLLHYSWGVPADTDRDVIDSSYDYAINSFFIDREQQDVYQDHPIHHEFVANHSSIWKTVKVYDNLIK